MRARVAPCAYPHSDCPQHSGWRVKFLCDRCKTRYSIGDDRVRGKILKIRCKNCANVITVREGMPDVDADAGAERRGRPTTAAPMSSIASFVANKAAAGAGARESAKPPAALEEEWYVSIDGDQSGPFSLADAQRWVGSKSIDAELHCWSEGFDDWLPVDKVSHFRGLRKKPAPPPVAPPPLPRVGGRSTGAARPIEAEPKPLFAATMATLEAGASARMQAAPAPAPVPVPPKAPAPLPSPIARSGPTANGSAMTPALAKSGPSARPVTSPGVGAASTGAAALAAAFAADADDEGENSTSIDQSPFSDLAPPPSAAASALPAAFNPPPRAGSPPGDAVPEDDGLDIGEVSRVVKLADLGKMAANRSQKNAATRMTGANASIGRTTSGVPRIPASELGLAPPPPISPTGMPMAPGDNPGESMVVPAPVATHRRGIIILIVVAAVLLLGVIGAVVMIVNSSSDDNGPLIGRTQQIDTSRPEDTGGRRILEPGAGSNKPNTTSPRPWIPRPNNGGGSNNLTTNKGSADQQVAIDPTKAPRKADDVEDMFRKQQGGIDRCYIRAQKDMTIGDVKKINVTLTVDKDGGVTDVDLSDHGQDSLGKCLTTRVKSMKFGPAQSAGTFKIGLAAPN